MKSILLGTKCGNLNNVGTYEVSSGNYVQLCKGYVGDTTITQQVAYTTGTKKYMEDTKQNVAENLYTMNYMLTTIIIFLLFLLFIKKALRYFK